VAPGLPCDKIYKCNEKLLASSSCCKAMLRHITEDSILMVMTARTSSLVYWDLAINKFINAYNHTWQISSLTVRIRLSSLDYYWDLVLPWVLLQHSYCPKLKTMRREGCKDGCFWTPVPSVTCAKAVCSRLSQRQHGVGCQVKPCGCDCPSQLRKILFSNFKRLKPLNISRMFIKWAIKHYKVI
jgi:hypothetical protein